MPFLLDVLSCNTWRDGKTSSAFLSRWSYLTAVYSLYSAAIEPSKWKQPSCLYTSEPGVYNKQTYTVQQATPRTERKLALRRYLAIILSSQNKGHHSSVDRE